MNSPQQVFWIETGSAEPIPAALQTLEKKLIISHSDGRVFQWDKSHLVGMKVAGSSGKFYIHPLDSPYPRILTDFPLSGIKGVKPGKSRAKDLVPPVLLFSGILLSFIALMVWLVWKGLPLLADRLAVAVPESWEQEIGKEIKNQVLSSLEVDSSRTIIINKLMEDFRFSVSKETGFARPEFVVVRKMEFNAFAMPGGSIVIHSGAIEKINSLPALMALAGHENGHVQGRHSLRTLARSLGLYALISMLAGDFTGLAAVLAENAQSLQNLSYSRDFEREADKASMDFLCRNGIDAAGLVELMEIMEKETAKNAAEAPAILSSHPLTSERLSSARQAKASADCPVRFNPVSDSLFRLLRKP